MITKAMGAFMLFLAALNVWLMFVAYPNVFFIVHALISLWFVHRGIWWIERGTMPSNMTPEQIEEANEAVLLAQEMLQNGKDKKEVEEWLKARLNIIQSRGQNAKNEDS